MSITTGEATLSGSSVEIITPSFFFGSATNNISSSNDDLSITTKNLIATGSSVQLSTPSFELGSRSGTGQFISGSDGGIEISGSNFHLKKGNIIHTIL